MRLLAVGRWAGVSHAGEPCLALRRGVRVADKVKPDGGEKHWWWDDWTALRHSQTLRRDETTGRRMGVVHTGDPGSGDETIRGGRMERRWAHSETRWQR